MVYRTLFLRWRLALPLVCLLLLVGWAGLAGAQNLTQGYTSDQPLQNGMIVRLVPKNSTKVEVLKQENQADMLGVTVASTDSPISISDPTKNQVFVATYGKYPVLVSNQNGQIKSGDFITISSLDGVGMKGDRTQELILGKALNGFNGAGDSEGSTQLSSKTGQKTTVTLKRIMVDISVARNPIYSGDVIAGVPNFLAKTAHLVSSKPITAVRIYACLGILALALLVGGAIIYAGVRTGMRSVGRNPLAKKSILRGLVSVTLMALIVVTLGLIAVYLLLRI